MATSMAGSRPVVHGEGRGTLGSWPAGDAKHNRDDDSASEEKFDANMAGTLRTP